MTEVKQETKYYTYPEAAQLLRCSEKTLYIRVRDGEIIPLRNGRLVLFTEECIESFLKKDCKNDKADNWIEVKEENQ